ncbi:TetR/AcrR family transcriptional regulator [Streptomyces sp. NBRC 109706]|uniref:TetR/AcrR family transcriptional regulator n=1 Tax=Streptomyces sp. NBRC 109706 TaxID=1550035 RepID=UPI0007812CF8|nr:TetR/AcrR family transcriptional regulator [Streptomyces sp. NBRC 109706]
MPEPQKKGRPLRRDAEQNRRKVVDAGREVFAERGLSATLNDVAHHAGLGVGTVYRRFPDKASLAEAVFADELADIRTMAAEALADGGEAFEAFAAFLERALERLADNRGLREVMRQGGFGSDRLAATRAELTQDCGRLMDRAHAAGTLRGDVTPADIPAIVAMFDAALDASPDDWPRYLSIIVTGLHTPRTP